jgi:NIPSNAP
MFPASHSLAKPPLSWWKLNSGLSIPLRIEGTACRTANAVGGESPFCQRASHRFPASALIQSTSARILAVKRRTFVQTLPAATLLPASLWAAARQANANSTAATGAVFELRVYHAAAGKLAELEARFRDHTIKIFDRHGMKSVAYWTPLDEPEKSNTLIYILQHPSREAAAANWKAFQDDPEWKSVKEKSEANGKLVDKVDSTYLALTDFSPRLR